MADTNYKKYLDQAGVQFLWGKILEAIGASAASEVAARNAAIKVEADRAALAEADLASTIGTLPESFNSVIEYINAKTEGIATDTALAELQDAINAIAADYLKGADKTALEDKVTAEETARKAADTELDNRVKTLEAIDHNAYVAADSALKTELEGKVTAEATARAEADTALGNRVKALEDVKDAYVSADATLKSDLEGAIAEALQAAKDYADANDVDTVYDDTALAGRVSAIEGDYLKAADKTELEGKITAEETRAKGVEESLQTQINTIMNNPDTENVINSINEFTAYIEEHGDIADGLRSDIDDNAEAIAAEVLRATGAEGVLSGRIDALEAIDHEAYVAADTALKAEIMVEVNKKADASVVEAMDTAYKAADSALEERITDVETQLTGGTGSVATQIATAKEEAIEAAAADATSKADAAQAAAEATAAADATSKANAAESAAKAYADGLNTAMDERVVAVEGKAHVHANAAELDKIADGDKAKWDAAAAKAHTHSNATVLDGITSTKVSAWDSAEANAKAYADGLAKNYDVNGAAAQALVDAKAYTDAEVAKCDVKGAAAQAYTDSKTYTDAEIAKIVPLTDTEILAAIQAAGGINAANVPLYNGEVGTV